MISNASPLIILTKLDVFDKLFKLYKEIEISKEVFEESIKEGIKNNKQDSILLNAFYNEGKIKVIGLDNKHSKIAKNIQNNYKLDKGESETIALALQQNQKIILMDESMGRKIAKVFNIKPKGSLRVLLELYIDNIIDENQLVGKVNELIGKQFRLDAEILNKFWELFEKLKK